MVHTTLLHKTPYGAENTLYYLLFAIELMCFTPFSNNVVSNFCCHVVTMELQIKFCATLIEIKIWVQSSAYLRK